MLGKIFPNNEERQTQHIIGCSAVSWERHCRAYVLELEPSSKATNLVSYSHLNIHLEQITLDLTTGHIYLNWNQVPKPQPQFSTLD